MGAYSAWQATAHNAGYGWSRRVALRETRSMTSPAVDARTPAP